MPPTPRPPRFVPVLGTASVGRLRFAGRAESARIGQGVSGDGLWREVGRRDGGALFLLVDIEDKGPKTVPLREVLERALDGPETWDLTPGELLVELHSQAAVAWAETGRYFHAQAVLARPADGHFLLASAAIPNPYRAANGSAWEVIEAPTESVCMLGIPFLHPDPGPAFPDRSFGLGPGDGYLACTDGITDLGKRNGLRPQDVLDHLNGMADRPEPEELLRRVFELAASREGASWPGDDSTGLAWTLRKE